MSDEMVFPPGEPVAGEDPRRLSDEFWRAHDRNANAPYGERYVTFARLIERALTMDDAGWSAFARSYTREHARRRLAPGTELDWMERVRAYRGDR